MLNLVPVRTGRIICVMCGLATAPLVIALLHMPLAVVLTLIAFDSLALIVYGSYWTMRAVHASRRADQ